MRVLRDPAGPTVDDQAPRLPLLERLLVLLQGSDLEPLLVHDVAQVQPLLLELLEVLHHDLPRNVKLRLRSRSPIEHRHGPLDRVGDGGPLRLLLL